MKWNKKTTGLALSSACALIMAMPAQAFEFSAMGDASYNTTDATGEYNNFAIGGLDSFVRAQIDDNTEAFIEYVFENDGSGFVLDVERLYVKRNLNETNRIGIGRFHSPLGYWNNTFHHGVIMQDTVSRPAFLDFEDGDSAILPTHAIGLWFEGTAGPVGYELAVANNTFLSTGNFGEIGIGNVQDYSNSKTFFGRLTYAPNNSLHFGVSAKSGDILEDGSSTPAYTLAAGDTVAKQTITGVDFRYKHDKFNVLGEYFNLDNKATSTVKANGGTSGSGDAYYVQAGYQATEKLRPTLRYESFKNDGDVYFTTLGKPEYTANVLALRYDLDDSNVLTFQYKKTSPTGGEDVTEMVLDWAFLIF